MQYYLRKKFFKGIFLFHKFFTKTTRPLQGFYGILLTPAYQDKTFEYCFKGTYGTRFSQWLADLKEEMVFIDIGANQGLYSVLAGKNPAVKKVFSFEPNDAILPLLKNNLKVNRIENYKVIPAAISERTGELTLQTLAGHSGRATLRTLDHTPQQPLTTKTIQTLSCQDIDKHISEELPNGIKIDVEGHEEVVIQELVKCAFFKQTQWIFCEIDEKWVSPKKIYDLLKKEGFTHFEKMGNHPTHYDVMIRR